MFLARCFFHSARPPAAVDCSGGSSNASILMQGWSRKWSRCSVSWRSSLRTPRSVTCKSVRSPLLVSEWTWEVVSFWAVHLSVQRPHSFHIHFNCAKVGACSEPFQKREKSSSPLLDALFWKFSLQRHSFVMPVSALMSTSDCWLTTLIAINN